MIEGFFYYDGPFRPLAPPHSHRSGGEMENWVTWYRHETYLIQQFIYDGFWDVAESRMEEWEKRFQADPLLKRLILEYDGDYMMLEGILEEEFIGQICWDKEKQTQASEPHTFH